MIATPLAGGDSGLQAWRPILEFGDDGWEWVTLSKAWAEEWVENKQWPFLWMADQLNKTGIWPEPKSPWPSWCAPTECSSESLLKFFNSVELVFTRND